MASAVRDLELDLDAFEGPFDLLLTLLLKDAIQPAEIDMAGIVVAFVERLAERDELDLDACGEFLVLIAALLELFSGLESLRGRWASIAAIILPVTVTGILVYVVGRVLVG